MSILKNVTFIVYVCGVRVLEKHVFSFLKICFEKPVRTLFMHLDWLVHIVWMCEVVIVSETLGRGKEWTEDPVLFIETR